MRQHFPDPYQQITDRREPTKARFRRKRPTKTTIIDGARHSRFTQQTRRHQNERPPPKNSRVEELLTNRETLHGQDPPPNRPRTNRHPRKNYHLAVRGDRRGPPRPQHRV